MISVRFCWILSSNLHPDDLQQACLKSPEESLSGLIDKAGLAMSPLAIAFLFNHHFCE